MALQEAAGGSQAELLANHERVLDGLTLAWEEGARRTLEPPPCGVRQR